MSSQQVPQTSLTYLTGKQAAAVDKDLMGSLSFTLDQLMELAGLSVASAVQQSYESKEHSHVLVVCGPGNNGGDGLVAARHLKHFGFHPCVWYPKPGKNPFYSKLQQQCEALGITVKTDTDAFSSEAIAEYHIVLDAIFGFSFKGDVRAPFDSVLQSINDAKVPVVAVDIPSGWHVEEGNISKQGLTNVDVLVSLTTPKQCARSFQGRHFLGGRFVPPAILDKYGLQLPSYPGCSQVVEL